MPSNEAQWFWFIFFAGGAFGGWLLIPLALIEFWHRMFDGYK